MSEHDPDWRWCIQRIRDIQNRILTLESKVEATQRDIAAMVAAANALIDENARIMGKNNA